MKWNQSLCDSKKPPKMVRKKKYYAKIYIIVAKNVSRFLNCSRFVMALCVIIFFFKWIIHFIFICFLFHLHCMFKITTMAVISIEKTCNCMQTLNFNIAAVILLVCNDIELNFCVDLLKRIKFLIIFLSFQHKIYINSYL